MKILVLSCNTGQGHNTAARAIQEELDSRGTECTVIDALALTGQRYSKAISQSYINKAVHAPKAFGVMYRAGGKISSDRHKSPVYLVNKLQSKRLEAMIVQGGYDAVISSHLFPAQTLTSLQRHGRLHVPFYIMATDYTCIPFWEELEPAAFFIPHRDLAGECIQHGIPEKKLIVTGIPVSRRFYAPYDRDEVRRGLDLPLQEPVFLVMTGSMGFGHVGDMIERILHRCENGGRIIVLGGNNEKLKAGLRRRFAASGQVSVLDFTTAADRYMEACDVLFTKPGGLTTTEAAVRRIPLVHTNPIPGCETRNVIFFSSRGMSVYDSDPDRLVERAFRLATSDSLKDAMRAAQEEYINRYAARDICEYVIQQHAESMKTV